MKKYIEFIKHSDTTTIVIWCISLIFIILGVYISFLLYCSNRNLWLDEAMLAYSLNTRSLFDLTRSVLEMDQSAPVLYLYVVKIITLIFNTSEFTLRILSFTSFVGVLVLVYLLMKDAFTVRYPILCTSFVSNLFVLLYYSNEFKPYMTDCFIILIVLYLYYLYNKGTLKILSLSLVYSILLWFSNPAIFFAGAVFIYEFVKYILNKDKISVYKTFLGGMIIIVSFLILYILWLKPVANSEYMIQYWEHYKFPLIPKSINDIKKIMQISRELIAVMSRWTIVLLLLICSGIIISITAKNKYSIVISISILLVLIASYIGKYPFYQRLMLFIYPIFSILIFIALDSLMRENKKWHNNALIVGLIILVFAGNFKSLRYLNYSNRFNGGEEPGKLIEYVDENIQENQLLYVYYHAIPVFSFMNGYDNLHIGKNIDDSIDNIILGEHFNTEFKNDIGIITSFDECYILFSHIIGDRIKPLMEALEEKGSLQLILTNYSTPLYLYTKDN